MRGASPESGWIPPCASMYALWSVEYALATPEYLPAACYSCGASAQRRSCCRWAMVKDRAMAARKTMSEGCSVLAGTDQVQRGNCHRAGDPACDIVPSRAMLRPAIPRSPAPPLPWPRATLAGCCVALAAWPQGPLARPVPVHSTRRRIRPLVIPQQPHAHLCLTSSCVDSILRRVGGTAQRLGALRSPWPSSSMAAVPVVHPVLAWSTHAS
jgi:hypothetical protein